MKASVNGNIMSNKGKSNIVDEVEVTITFRRTIDRDGEINEVGKDNLEMNITNIKSEDYISVPLHHYIEEEIGLNIRSYDVGHYKLISKW